MLAAWHIIPTVSRLGFLKLFFRGGQASSQRLLQCFQLPDKILATYRGIFITFAVFQNSYVFILLCLSLSLSEPLTVFCRALSFRGTLFQNNWPRGMWRWCTTHVFTGLIGIVHCLVFQRTKKHFGNWISSYALVKGCGGTCAVGKARKRLLSLCTDIVH